MKLQYRCFECATFVYKILLYCDGHLAKAYEVWFDELNDELDSLKEQGYSYGYTEKEINKAKEEYERVLANALIRKETE